MDFCEAAWDKSLLVYLPACLRVSVLLTASIVLHTDFCEAACDKSLLYEGGWKKKLKYVLAICPTSVVDVTPRYTRQYAVVSQRRAVPDSWLKDRAQAVTQQLRASLPSGILQALELRDVSEQLELLGRATEQSPLNPEEAAAQGLKGRQTGDDEWRKARGEDGGACGTQGGESATTECSSRSSAPAATIWRPLPPFQEHDEHVDVNSGPASVCARAGRLMGGACRASGENSGEEAVNAFDGSVLNKWLDFGGGGLGGSAWLELRLMDTQGALASSPLLSYDIVSANDCPERDPRDWVVEGLSLQDEQAGNLADAWQILDVQKDVAFTDRHQLRSFACAYPRTASSSGIQQQQQQALPYWRRFRLRITSTADPAAANSVQLAAWDLFGLPQPAPLSLVPAQNSSSLGAAGADGVEACQQAAHQVVQAKAACLLAPHQVELLRKVGANVAHHPEDPRYRRLRASKVLTLASSPEAMALLLTTGFRPLVLDEPALFFVLEAGGHAVRRAASAAEILNSCF
ncbi:hypothetical protein DUNSADRAFT_963 [Dunaliella salina]|uniref:Uncharacterized protein n=2 Tax=Dunaliella salina TaxID=3046 RepID=A0ABQ7GXQ3_DUNSA|nr:hypothetical protein DUNSADRAFT_963 [Dunaliella salina]|eukprot:KAF5839392.1 hypothetical protein DUNSADRAFT_963 [Dunaliella salina]